MNARTSRLLTRVAHAMHQNDPRDPREPQAKVLERLKAAWNKTSPDKREEARRGLVAIFNQLMGERT